MLLSYDCSDVWIKSRTRDKLPECFSPLLEGLECLFDDFDVFFWECGRVGLIVPSDRALDKFEHPSSFWLTQSF